MTRSFILVSLTTLALFALRANAQAWSNATCTAQLWSFNTLQQSPCLVSAYLSAQCTSDNYWGVPEIGTQGPYAPPSSSYANRCRCNSVQWNLLSACSMCQGGPAGTWQEWIGNCSFSAITVGNYPLPVPSGVSVPHWAYYDFTTSGVFNAMIASQQSGPESSAVATPTPVPTFRTTAVTGGSTRSLADPISTNSATNAPGSGGSNTGAIVGGVVGGVLGIALIAVIVLVLMRKGKQNKTAEPTTQHPQGGYGPAMGAQPNTAAPMMAQYQPSIQHSSVMSPPPQTSEFKPYDPSDPSTFPNHSTPSHYTESLHYSQQTRPGQYAGVAEV